LDVVVNSQHQRDNKQGVQSTVGCLVVPAIPYKPGCIALHRCIAALSHCGFLHFLHPGSQAVFFHGSDTLVTGSLGRFQDDSGSALHFHGQDQLQT
jgi:hypothetical protein